MDITTKNKTSLITRIFDYRRILYKTYAENDCTVTNLTFNEYKRLWTKYIAFCSDGAPNMLKLQDTLESAYPMYLTQGNQ
jgi:hypothetical protein